MLKGIDVSKWQGNIDWDLVLSSDKNDIQFAFIRASYGTGFRDEYFEKNRQAVIEKGMPHGFYHYAYPTLNTPEAEADWFASVVGDLRKEEILALDFEESYPDPVGWSKRFLDRLSSKYGGYKPLIYINKYLSQTYDWKPVIDGNYGLWLAYWDYLPDADTPDVGWLVAFRQYTNKLIVEGIGDGVTSRVDGNVFYGDATQLVKYGYAGSSNNPDVPPTTIAELEAKIQELEKELDEMRASRNYWRTLQKDTQKKYETEVASLNSQLNACQLQLKVANELNNTLNDQLKTVKAERDLLKSENESLKAENQELQGYKEKYEKCKAEKVKVLCDFPYWQRVLSLLRCR